MPYEYDWQHVAERAYIAYGKSTGNKNFRGDPMPDYADLPDAIKAAWEAAVKGAKDALGDGFKKWVRDCSCDEEGIICDCQQLSER